MDQTGERLGETETDHKMSMSWVSSALVSARHFRLCGILCGILLQHQPHKVHPIISTGGKSHSLGSSDFNYPPSSQSHPFSLGRQPVCVQSCQRPQWAGVAVPPLELPSNRTARATFQPTLSTPSLLPSLLSKTVGQSLPSRNVPSSRTSDPCLHNWRATALYFVLRTAAGEKGHSHRWFTSNHLVAALRLPFPWTPRPRAHHHLDRPRPPLSHHPPLSTCRQRSECPQLNPTHRQLIAWCPSILRSPSSWGFFACFVEF